MKNKTEDMKKTILILFILAFNLGLNAQDLILRKNPKAEINCKIIEIGEDLVYYTSFLAGEDRKFSIDKNNIVYIKFANGEVINMENSMFTKNNYQDNTKNAIKFNFFSPLVGYTNFEYERSIKPGQSGVLGLGILGLGFKPFDNDAYGLSLYAGYRFYRSPDYYLRQLKYSHLLKGSYIMPKLQFTLFNTQIEDSFYNQNTGIEEWSKQNKTIIAANILITGGKQWVFSNRFLIDLNFGLGYSFSNIKESDNYQIHVLGLFYGASTRFLYSSSIKLGYLFHTKKESKALLIDRP